MSITPLLCIAGNAEISYTVLNRMKTVRYTRWATWSLLLLAVSLLVLGSCDQSRQPTTVPQIPVAGEVWSLRDAPNSNNLFAVASSGSRHVAAGFKGTLLLADSLDGWVNGPPVGNSTWSSAVSGDHGFLIGATSGLLRLSDDGLQWSASDTELGQAIVSLVWLDSVYVAVGEAGGVALSTDGRDWTASQIGEPMSSVTSLYGTYAAVGPSSRTARSQDGTTWQVGLWISQEGAGDLLDLAFDGYLAVAVGRSGAIATSADGRNWTDRTSPTAQDLVAVAWSGLRFVAVGSAGTIIVSEDGILWREIDSPTDRNLNDIVWTGEAFIAVGSGGTIVTSP